MSNATLAPIVIDPRGDAERARLDLWKKTVAKGATDLEFEMFAATCQRTGLDPLARQIHAVFRGQGDNRAMTIQVGIDGYRLLADRTGAYAGSDEPLYEEDKAADHPLKATVTVWRIVAGVRCPFTASARWNEYKQERSPMWSKMPYLMLGKCAEALALRKAFPAELSGLYTREEMDQAGDGVVVEATGEIVDAPRPAPIRPAVVVDAPPAPPDPVSDLRRNWEYAAHLAHNAGLLVPQLPEDADEAAIKASGAAIKASLKEAKKAGLDSAYAELEKAGVPLDDSERPELGQDAAYYEGAAKLWRQLAAEAAEKAQPF